ncbi:hypothetical protein Q4Q34_05670 [Flavivirga abyssicola]|uniref:hypothetical protein n=1 Tax=Flavivirga abyssicola TaxID=3063533 RepID=UPI0026DF190E|nr:hypothetical protein [Flavivirga sp. MEBiC07777]WVK14516.1 hypothetical protein Q4Q34_05670 [Flavivirga sp. MEBiC07777]
MTYEKPIDRFCSIFGHNYLHVDRINNETSELICKSCNNRFISTNNGNIINLSVYKDMSKFPNYLKRRRVSRLSKTSS